MLAVAKMTRAKAAADKVNKAGDAAKAKVAKELAEAQRKLKAEEERQAQKVALKAKVKAKGREKKSLNKLSKMVKQLIHTHTKKIKSS